MRDGGVECWKYLHVRKLKELLNELDDDLLIGPNEVKNLALVDRDRGFVGYVDFAHEGTVERYDR